MKFEIITIFPDFFRGPLEYGIVRRARESGRVEITVHDLRAFTKDKHSTVDDRPFGKSSCRALMIALSSRGPANESPPGNVPEGSILNFPSSVLQAPIPS